MSDDVARENLRLARRVQRLQATLEQVELISDGNARLLNRLMDDLEAERRRSHDLLLNVLPERIVARLDAGETRIADRHESAVVVMADIVGFTESAARSTPAVLVEGLNEVFTRFDDACVRRGVEKIKTIGDAYMAVAGLESGMADADGDGPAIAAAHLALDMIELLAGSDHAWNMRIGIHAGPVVAGIIGTRKFAYDIWGDTVNVASRLEATSQPGRIQVSEPVARALESGGRFELEFRGDVELKGKGAMRTWFLLGRRSALPD